MKSDWFPSRHSIYLVWTLAGFSILTSTFAPLGTNWTGVTGPMKGTHNGEVVLKTAIVDSTPPLP